MPFDINIFNTDPKHEKDREQLDAMIEGSLLRLKEKHKKAEPEEEPNIFDKLFGGKKDESENS